MRQDPQKAFTAAQDFRKRIPLPAGRYKLEEALWELQRLRKTVEGAARIVGSKDREAAKAARAALCSCSSHELGHYLKQIPSHVADLLGRKILPGIAALHADGVPTQVVRQRTAAAEARAETILRDCDHVHCLLRKRIRIEYDALKEGWSRILPLIDAAEAVVAEALRWIRGG